MTQSNTVPGDANPPRYMPSPEVRRAAARAAVEIRTSLGEMPDPRIVEIAELDYVPVPRKVRWWERLWRR